MSTNPQKRSCPEDMVMRRRGGFWLKQLREGRNLSQKELVQKLSAGPRHYTFISQIEIGKARIPPHTYAAWADALGVPRREFGMQILRFYDPKMFALLTAKELQSSDLAQDSESGS